MPSCVVIVGGWAHPGEQTGPPLAEALESFGFRPEVVEDLGAAAGRVDAGTDLVVVHACYFQMLDARYNDDQRLAFASLTPEPLRDAISAHLAAGRPMLALHTAPICFDDWPEWSGLCGATWSWERSNHPPPGTISVRVDPAHPVVAGLAGFDVIDELYRFVEPHPTAQVVATATDADGLVQPLVWLHRLGPARVAYDSLGHDARSLGSVGHRALLGRLLDWLANGVM